MEEILASIRKIISEEPSSGAPSRPRPSDRPAPVLPSRVTPPPAKSGEREAEGRNFADSASQRPVGNVTGQRVEPAFGSSKQSNTPPLSGSQGGDQLLGRLSEALGRNVPSPTLRKTPLAETPMSMEPMPGKPMPTNLISARRSMDPIGARTWMNWLIFSQRLCRTSLTWVIG